MAPRVDGADVANFYSQYKPEAGSKGTKYTVENTLTVFCPNGEKTEHMFSIYNSPDKTIITGEDLDLRGYIDEELIVYGHGNKINGREIGNETENTKTIIDAASEKQKFELSTVTTVGNGSKPTETPSVKGDKNQSDSDFAVSIPVAFSRKGNADTEVKNLFLTLFEAKVLNNEVKTKDSAGTVRLNELESDKDGYVIYHPGDGTHKRLNINLPMLQKKLEELSTTPVKTPDAEKLGLKTY